MPTNNRRNMDKTKKYLKRKKKQIKNQEIEAKIKK